jgi:putative ABC transport system ATP-binding protein
MIELQQISKTVQSGGQPLTILYPLDLVISKAQFLAITGPSGSGKSTLLGLIAGLDAPSPTIRRFCWLTSRLAIWTQKMGST